MSFWKKIFGRDFEESVAHAQDLLEAGRPGEARLELEKAISKAKDVPGEKIEEARSLIAQARRRLTASHIEDGKIFEKEGDIERAIECYETAVEVAPDSESRSDAQRLLDQIEAEDARAIVEETIEMTEEERFQILSGAWEDERADELESYGKPFVRAYLDLADGNSDDAIEAMRELLEENDDALFLKLELGIALRQADQFEEAVKHLRQFLSGMDEEDDLNDDEDAEPFCPESQVRAHAVLAEVYIEQEDVAAAERELRALVDLLPEQSAPYVYLGQFLRTHDRNEEALEILEQGREFMGEIRPDMRVVHEIGLTQRALGKTEDAIDSLKSVLDYQAGMDDYNFSPATAVPLAELLEENSELERAADIYRHLAKGTHKEGHFDYNFNAGRLLAELDQEELARKHLARAKELAPDDESEDKIDEVLKIFS